MNTNKILVSILAILAILFTSSVSAMGPRDGSGKNAGNFVDTNNNGIADGQEDWDNDGILNKDDEDYERSYVNMKDDDGDGIPNKDDEDYVKPQDGTGNKNMNKNSNQNRMKNGSGSMNGSGTGAINRQKNMMRNQSKYVDNAKKAKYKNLIQNKYQEKIDSLSTEKLQTLLTKIDDLEAKIEASTTYTEDKKESIITVLEALREVVLEKLESEELNIDSLLQ